MPNIFTVAASFVGGQMAGSASQAFSPITRGFTYTANWVMPNLLDEPSTILKSYFMEVASEANLKDTYRYHGMRLDNFSLDTIRYSNWHNDKANYDHGYRDKPTTLHERAIRAEIYLPSIDEAKFLRNRELISDELAEFIVAKQTGRNDAMTKAWLKTRYEIPGPSDLIRFAVRGGFDEQEIRSFGYHHETPIPIQKFMEQQGYGGTTGMYLPPGGTNSDGSERTGSATWFDLYWWSHWELPSPSQNAEMLFRLYPSSPRGPSPYTTDNVTYTEADYARLQKAHDIPDVYRKRLEAISYNVPTRVDVRRMYEMDIIDDNDVYHSYRASGYNDDTAEKMLRFARRLKTNFRGLKYKEKPANWYCQLHSLGILQPQEFRDRMHQLGFSESEAAAFVEQCQTDLRMKRVNDTIKLLKQAFLLGIYTQGSIEEQLFNAGVHREGVDRFVNHWMMLKLIKYKMVSASTNLEYFQNGVIDETELTARLQNLGYDGSEVTKMIVNMRIKLTRKRTQLIEKELAKRNKLLEKETKEKEKQLKDVAKTIADTQKKADAQARDRVKKLLGASTDKNLKDWFAKGLISITEVATRLAIKDWPEGDIKRWLLSNLKDISEKEANAAATQAKKQQSKSTDGSSNSGEL